MNDYAARLKCQMIAQFLNDHNVKVDLDGDLYLEEHPKSLYIDHRGEAPNHWEVNDGAPITTQKQSDDRTWT